MSDARNRRAAGHWCTWMGVGRSVAAGVAVLALVAGTVIGAPKPDAKQESKAASKGAAKGAAKGAPKGGAKPSNNVTPARRPRREKTVGAPLPPMVVRPAGAGTTPKYTPEGRRITGPVKQVNVDGLPISELAREILRRSTEIRPSEGPVKSLHVAGCMYCHTSLEGISVGTFVEHIDHRELMHLSENTGALGGHDVSVTAAGAAVGEPAETNGAEELKKAIEASGQNIRPAGSMASELARERWEAERLRLAAEADESDVERPDWERALIFIEKGDFERALPFVKAHVGAQAEAEAKASAAAVAAAMEAARAKDGLNGAIVVRTSEQAEAELKAEVKADEAASEEPVVVSPPLDETKRLLAFVLLKVGQADTASALIRDMYREDPRLARRVFAFASMRVSERQLHEGFSASVGFANRAKTGSGWLQAAVLAQAEARLPLARTLIDRAAAAGLSKDIADAFAAAVDEAMAAEKAERAGKGKVVPAERPPGQAGKAGSSVEVTPQ